MSGQRTRPCDRAPPPRWLLDVSARSARALGLVGFGLVSTALQLRVIELAGRGCDLAASRGASAANAGIATGALVGGLLGERR
jgi:predicted MFS family arabinose efflux permease